MPKRSDPDNREDLREKIIGLGERSLRKTYYPELQEKLVELERFRALLDQSNDCIFLVSVPSLLLVDVNESACRQLGYGRQDLLSRTLGDLLPDDAAATVSQLVDPAGGCSAGGTEVLTTVLLPREGKGFPAEITFRLVSFGQEQYGVAVARDITERNKAEEVLKTQFSQISTIFDSLNALVFVADLENSRFLYMNRYGEAMFGDDWREKGYQYFFSGGEREGPFCAYEPVVSEGEPLAPVISESFNSVTGRWYQCIDRAIWWTDGRLVRLEIAVDITEFKEIERLKDQMISAVSHEMRTPLTAIIGFTELLLSGEVMPADEKSHLKTMYGEAERLNRLVQNFMDLQRTRTGEQAYRFQDVSMCQLLSEVIVQSAKVSPRHRLTLDCATDLPAVRGDRERLGEVIINLISNAVKYSPEGGLVAVTGGVDGGNVVVSVRDEGIGIPPEVQGRIFQRFYRVDNTDRRMFTGAGLGLAVVWEVVTAHGGRVWVESTPGKGSTFFVQLRPGDGRKGSCGI